MLAESATSMLEERAPSMLAERARRRTARRDEELSTPLAYSALSMLV
jgi:hypothetical protein